MLKDANKYATELKSDLDLDGDPQISFKSTEGHTHNATSLDGTKRVVHKARTYFTKSEIKESKWPGNIVFQRLGDETIDLSDCFDWSRNWISAPTFTTCGVNEIYQQLTSDRLCRKCHQYPETMEHILSGCPELAQRQYLWRYNDASKWVLSELLIAYKFREKQLPLRQEPHSNYNNTDVEILWDCTVSTDKRLEEEGNRPDLVVTD